MISNENNSGKKKRAIAISIAIETKWVIFYNILHQGKKKLDEEGEINDFKNQEQEIGFSIKHPMQ